MDLFEAVKLVVFDPLYTLLIGGPLLLLLVQPTLFLLRNLIGNVRHLEREELVEYAKDTLLDIFAILLVGTHEFNITRWSRAGVALLVAIIGLKCLHHLIQIRLNHLHEAGLSDENAMGRLSRLILSFLLLSCVLLKLTLAMSTGVHSDRFIFTELVGQVILSTFALGRLATLYVHFSLEAHMPDGNGWPLKSEFWFVFDLLSDITALGVWLFIYADGATPMLSAVGYLQMQNLGRQVYRRVTAFMRYRSLTARLGADFPNATLDELENADVCIICRDLLTIGCKRLQCGHVLHFECLKNWFMHHQTCPTCRADIVIPSSQPPAQSSSGQSGTLSDPSERPPVPGQEPRYVGEVELSPPTILKGINNEIFSNLMASMGSDGGAHRGVVRERSRWRTFFFGPSRSEQSIAATGVVEFPPESVNEPTVEQLTSVLDGMYEQQKVLSTLMDYLDMRGGC